MLLAFLQRGNMQSVLRYIIWLSLLPAACSPGGSGDAGFPDDLSGFDPRCTLICVDQERCAWPSSELCLGLCEDRIADADELCAECLLAGARFEGTPQIFCAERCFAGGCSWDRDDDRARAECLETACRTELRPVAECDDLCDD